MISLIRSLILRCVVCRRSFHSIRIVIYFLILLLIYYIIRFLFVADNVKLSKDDEVLMRTCSKMPRDLDNDLHWKGTCGNPKVSVTDLANKYSVPLWSSVSSRLDRRNPRDEAIFHITKEFDECSMGGLGIAVTSMAIQQARRHSARDGNRLQVYGVVPWYTYLTEVYGKNSNVNQWINNDKVWKEAKDRFERGVDLPESFIASKVTTIMPLTEVDVPHWPLNSFLFWNYGGKSLKSVKIRSRIALVFTPETQLFVILIGPGNVAPYHRAFFALSKRTIYGYDRNEKGEETLDNETKDAYFLAVVAQFFDQMERREKKRNENVSRIRTVHLHGGTNAHFLWFIQRTKFEIGPLNDSRVSLPDNWSFVYTLHDYSFEFRCKIHYSTISTFIEVDWSSEKILQMQYLDEKNYVMTSLAGLALADVVTVVSLPMSLDLVTVIEPDYRYAPQVSPLILRRSREGRFFGINNGLDLHGSWNPFTHPQLKQLNAHFPTSPKLGSLLKLKKDMKRYLVQQGVISSQHLNHEWILFIGRFSWDKGIAAMEHAASALRRFGNATLIVVGQPLPEVPMSYLTFLKNYKNVLVFDQQRFQDEYGAAMRVAADIFFLPTLTESFGLVAAEALLFGQLVVASRVGGLTEFLKDTNDHDKQFLRESVASFLPEPDMWLPRDERVIEEQSLTYEISIKEPLMEVKMPAATMRPFIDSLDQCILAMLKENLNNTCSKVPIFDHNAILHPPGPRKRGYAIEFQGATEALLMAIVDLRRMQYETRELFTWHLIVSSLQLTWMTPLGPLDQWAAVYGLAQSRK